MSDLSAIGEYLRTLSFFEMLSSEELKMLSDESFLTHEQKGQIIVHEGTIPDCLYVVKEGRLCQYFLEFNGGKFLIDNTNCGGVIPIDIALANTRSRYTIEAAKKSELIHIPLQPFKTVLAGNAAFTHRMLDKLINQSVLLTDIIRRMTLTAPSRLSHHLINLMFTNGKRNENGGVTFKLDMTKKDLAASLGIAPETLSRLFLNLQNDGVVSVDKSQITVHDVFGLVSLSVGIAKT